MTLPDPTEKLESLTLADSSRPLPSPSPQRRSSPSTSAPLTTPTPAAETDIDEKGHEPDHATYDEGEGSRHIKGPSSESSGSTKSCPTADTTLETEDLTASISSLPRVPEYPTGSGSLSKDDAPPPPPLPTPADHTNFDAWLEAKHPRLSFLVNQEAFIKIKSEALANPLRGYDWIDVARDGLFTPELPESFPELLSNLEAGGASTVVLSVFKEFAAIAKAECGVGEDVLAIRMSARGWMRYWEYCPPVTELTVMTSRRSVEKKKLEKGKGGGGTTTPLGEFLEAADDDAHPKLFHGTPFAAGNAIKTSGFSFRKAASMGDLGDTEMVYFSNEARFAAAWAIYKTDPHGWYSKHIGMIRDMKISVLSVPRPAPPAGPPCSLPESDATTEWLYGNQAPVKDQEVDADGNLIRARVPLAGGKLVHEYAWIEAPFPPENVKAWRFGVIPNITGLSKITQNEETAVLLRQWGFTELGLPLISKEKVRTI